MSDFTIGLFGTCGSSTWRAEFIEMFKQKNINFYNPQLGEGEWNPDFADEYVKAENFNLKNNEVILFPITDETTAQGSLAEIGFSVADTLRNLNERYLIVFIDPKCNADVDINSIKDSERSRKLVLSKCIDESLINPKVFVVYSLEEMKEVTENLCDYLLKNFNKDVEKNDNFFVVNF